VQLVETAIYAQWLQREWFEPWYARWTVGRFQGEVDMVGLSPQYFKPLWTLEIKWSKRPWENAGELKSQMSFCHINNLQSALVTTLDKSGSREIDILKLLFIPSALYAYAVGRNTIMQKQKRDI